MFNINLGKFLAKLRTENNLTQEQLANKLHIDKRKVSRWECGNSPPDFELLINLTEIFNITLYELSICQRLEKESLIQKAKYKFKTIKDIKRFNTQKKIGLILSIIIGIILGLNTIFTIDNYNTVEIYSLISSDKDFYIEGNYVKAKDYDVFNVTRLGYLGNDNLNINVYDIEYEVINNKIRAFVFSTNVQEALNNKSVNLLQTINAASFSAEKGYIELSDKNNIIFKIKYLDKEREHQSVEFEFKLLKKFQNSF